MHAAQVFLTWLRRVGLVVCVTAFAAAALALIADVLARELLGNGIFGAQRFAVWATAIAGLVGFRQRGLGCVHGLLGCDQVFARHRG